MATVLTKDYTKVKLFDGREVECADCKSYREMKKRIEVETDGKYPADQVILLQAGKYLYAGLRGGKFSQPGLPGVPKIHVSGYLRMPPPGVTTLEQ